MNKFYQFMRRHFVALIGNMILFTSLPVVLYTTWGMLLNDPGGPLAFFAVPLCNGICAALFFPVVIIAELVLRKCRRRVVTERFLVTSFGVGLILLIVLCLGVLLSPIKWGEYLAGAMFFGGIPLLLGGPVYLFLLHISDALLDTISGKGKNTSKQQDSS